jgi:hypothetical protein
VVRPIAAVIQSVTAWRVRMTTNAQAVKLGNVACAAIRDGINSGLSMGKARSQADQAVGYASQSLGVGLSEADGMNLVDIADQQLC